ncbi:hypothetical protein [Tahibacter amnicola]|uniref:Uncharacterized protein n=1 Tax=Tahibacter amnicola TaxID=2976241 RepID=A0ABY6BIJ8_9GAMM|nr:hypothetical protein [Tahibacter amnicola]UXI68441.1 hypothetical protein N4264_01960 [Tahibacter amnicola]
MNKIVARPSRFVLAAFMAAGVVLPIAPTLAAEVVQQDVVRTIKVELRDGTKENADAYKWLAARMAESRALDTMKAPTAGDIEVTYTWHGQARGDDPSSNPPFNLPIHGQNGDVVRFTRQRACTDGGGSMAWIYAWKSTGDAGGWVLRDYRFDNSDNSCSNG